MMKGEENVNTQELTCFLRVADRLNFTRAAQELYLTPPTVTHHIQRLEKELGVKLFDRDHKSVRLTAAGEIFYQEAQDILLRLKTAAARLEEARLREQQFFRLGCLSHQEPLRLRKVLQALRQDIPAIWPQFFVDDYYSLMRLLSEQQLDAVLGTRDMLHGFKECRFRPLYTCRRAAVFQAQRFPHQGQFISLQELADLPLIVLQQKNIPLQKTNNVEQLLAARTELKNYIRQESVEAVLALAESGYGVGILPECSFDQEKAAPDVSVCPIKESPLIEYGLLVPQKNKNPFTEAFYQAMKNYFC